MRFVIPVSTIHAAYNPRYFGRQRGSTLYSWMADTYTVFAQKLIPGTQRDSLHVLDGLLANQTGIQPEMVSTDTAGASEIVFALAWALGYRWAPRLADLPDQRLWRIDRDAHYGSLNGLARHRINTRLIAEHWDEICRLTASLRAGTVVPSAILRTLQRGPSPSSLARALAELGWVIKPCTCSNTPTTRPIAASSTTCSAAGNAATPSPGMSSTASAARSGGTTRSGRKTSSTASAS